MSDPTIEQLAREVLRLEDPNSSQTQWQRDVLYDRAAPQLARAYLEQQAEIERLNRRLRIMDAIKRTCSSQATCIAEQKLEIDALQAALDKAVTAHEQLLADYNQLLAENRRMREALEAAQQLLKDYRDILWRQLIVREELRDNPFPDYTRLKIDQIDMAIKSIKIALAAQPARGEMGE